MISHTIEVPSLGMTFDYKNVQFSDVSIEYDDYDYEYTFLHINSIASRTVTFRFNDGSTLSLRNGEYTIIKTVDLVEGKLYHMGKDNKKWLALCRYDEEFGELTLFPTTRRKYAPLVRNSDRMQYHFFEELEPDLKKYL